MNYHRPMYRSRANGSTNNPQARLEASTSSLRGRNLGRSVLFLCCLRRSDLAGNLIENGLHGMAFRSLVDLCFAFHCRELTQDHDIRSNLNVILFGSNREGYALDRIAATHRTRREAFERRFGGRLLERDGLPALLGHVELALGHLGYERLLDAIKTRSQDRHLRIRWLWQRQRGGRASKQYARASSKPQHTNVRRIPSHRRFAIRPDSLPKTRFVILLRDWLDAKGGRA